jgi:F-box/leucine-rich repeat protein 10/11
MPKFGGVGKMKQCCLTKQCIAPILPSTASCQICLKKKGSRKLSQLKPEEILYECERCMEIHHLPCFHVKFYFYFFEIDLFLLTN